MFEVDQTFTSNMAKHAKKQQMVAYARMFITTPYKWGGNGENLDCSGFICEVLKAFNYLGNKYDLTSAELFFKFKTNITAKCDAGNLAFYGKSLDEITHVAMCINNWQVIEAAGEGRTSTKNGIVRIRPLKYRSDLITVTKLEFE